MLHYNYADCNTIHNCPCGRPNPAVQLMLSSMFLQSLDMSPFSDHPACSNESVQHHTQGGARGLHVGIVCMCCSELCTHACYTHYRLAHLVDLWCSMVTRFLMAVTCSVSDTLQTCNVWGHKWCMSYYSSTHTLSCVILIDTQEA